MIKLNLLPGYVHEKGRIRLSIVVFLIVVGIEVGLIFWAKMGYEAQAKWFDSDKPYFTDRVAMITKEIDGTKTLNAPSLKYDALIAFFRGEKIIEYNKAVVETMAEVPSKLRGANAWFDTLNIKGKTVTMDGHVKGITNFVDFYFKMKGNGFTITPTGKTPMPWPANPRTQVMDVKISTELTAGIPAETEKAPEGTQPWGALYKAHSDAPPAAEGGAAPEGGAPPADGAAPAPGGPPAGAPPAPPAGAPPAGAPPAGR